jgi:hypothetical protein
MYAIYRGVSILPSFITYRRKLKSTGGLDRSQQPRLKITVDGKIATAQCLFFFFRPEGNLLWWWSPAHLFGLSEPPQLASLRDASALMSCRHQHFDVYISSMTWNRRMLVSSPTTTMIVGRSLYCFRRLIIYAKKTQALPTVRMYFYKIYFSRKTYSLRFIFIVVPTMQKEVVSSSYGKRSIHNAFPPTISIWWRRRKDDWSDPQKGVHSFSRSC